MLFLTLILKCIILEKSSGLDITPEIIIYVYNLKSWKKYKNKHKLN